MANRIYFCFTKRRTGKGEGWIEMHVSHIRKDVATDKPTCLSKAVKYTDELSYYKAHKWIHDRRQEMKDRFTATEIS